MGLRDTPNWPLTHYDSKINNIATEFFIPSLKNSTMYRRIGGLFSSTSFAIAARGIKELIENEGKMQLIISPILSKDDARAITDASQDIKDDLIGKLLKKELDNISSNFEKDHINALKYMLREGVLEIKIDVPKDFDGNPLDVETIINLNLLSEKRGIFQDRDGNTISFRGPVNENAQSWEKGIFLITVDVDWIEGQKPHVADDIKIFNSIWNDEKTLSLPEVIRKELVTTAPDKFRIDLEKYNIPPWAVLPNGNVLWANQIRVVNAWINNDFKGIFSIATGGGKTLASLVAANLHPNEKIILIVVPGKSIISQWENEIKEFEKNPDIVICDSDHANWPKILPGKITPFLQDSDINVHSTLYVLSTVQTAIDDKFQNIFQYLPDIKLTLIADEVHHLGSSKFRKIFNLDASRRIGLSATFRRDWDELGTREIIVYFGRELDDARYSISEGIRDGHLCQYRYIPFFAYLDNIEFENYVEYTIRIDQLFARLKNKENSFNNIEIPERLERLLMDRAEIIKKANDKIRSFKQIINSRPEKPYIVFADDNDQVELLKTAYKEQISQINLVNREFLRDDLLVFSGKSEIWQRNKILNEAVLHKTPIFAMYCLDEGIDVPEFQSAILVSSSTSERQYIQRRGRILRSGRKGKIANLYDIVVISAPSKDAYKNSIANDIIIKEKKRILELSNDAINKWEVIKKFEDEVERLGFGATID